MVWGGGGYGWVWYGMRGGGGMGTVVWDGRWHGGAKFLYLPGVVRARLAWTRSRSHWWPGLPYSSAAAGAAGRHYLQPRSRHSSCCWPASSSRCSPRCCARSAGCPGCWSSALPAACSLASPTAPPSGLAWPWKNSTSNLYWSGDYRCKSGKQSVWSMWVRQTIGMNNVSPANDRYDRCESGKQSVWSIRVRQIIGMKSAAEYKCFPCATPKQEITTQKKALQVTASATVELILSLPRVINSKLLLQPHQKYNTTQYEELGFS